jgi:hypothetical protein
MAGGIEAVFQPGRDAQALLARMRVFFFPGGENRGRALRAIRATERGEMRMSPRAKWISFTAEETIHATCSSFRWDARLGGGRLGFVTVTDAYEEGHGRLNVKLGGLIPTARLRGPELDRGELQRYLASIALCPPLLLNNQSLEYAAAGSALRVWDREDPAKTTVDIEIGEDGRPVSCRADRPRLVGKIAVPTPWSGVASEFREWEGIRVARRTEAAWLLPEGAFPYFRAEVMSFAAV